MCAMGDGSFATVSHFALLSLMSRHDKIFLNAAKLRQKYENTKL